MTLATEPPATPGEHVSHLEAWSDTERMRHIPSISWMVEKLDHDLRRRIDLLWNAATAASAVASDLEKEFRALCRSLDRVADVARRTRGNHHHPPAELGGRIYWSMNHTVSNLNAVDGETFGRRFLFHTAERSHAEPLWAAMLAVIEHVHRLTSLVRPIDPGIDERMYEGLVTLQTPLDPRPMA